MSDEERKAEETRHETPEATPEAEPKTDLGVLFLAAALALALVLSFVALLAYMAFSPGKTVNPPSQPAPAQSSSSAPAGKFPDGGALPVRLT